jgi:hypothetical protein
LKHKRKNIDDTTSVNMEATTIKETSKFIVHFTVGLTPLGDKIILVRPMQSYIV